MLALLPTSLIDTSIIKIIKILTDSSQLILVTVR
jgi:hypothetical protein